MKTYTVVAHTITKLTWEIEADSPEEALQKVKDCDYPFTPTEEPLGFNDARVIGEEED